MPKIAKKTFKESTAKGAAARIKPVGEDCDGLRLNVYGRGKTGKTRFACTFPKPLLILGTEKGTRSVSTVKGVDFVQILASGEIDELAEVASQRYKSVVLDTAGGLQDMVLKEILGLQDLPVQKSWGIARREDWGTCGMQTKERLRQLLSLSETHGTHVIIVAHERNFGEDGDTDLLFPSVGAALSPSVTNWLNGACDYICQTYIREQTATKEVKLGGKTNLMQQKTGVKEYCLRVGPHEVFMTGFRLPPGITLPDSIVDPNYTKVKSLIDGKSLS